MRNLVLVFGALFIASLFSCTGEVNQDTVDDTDSLEVVADTALQVTGVAIDGAMNSVYLKVGDDTVEFSYPDLDSPFRASWEIDDTLTVRYYVTENGDSVTEVINETAA
jgi:hypothetical protein